MGVCILLDLAGDDAVRKEGRCFSLDLANNVARLEPPCRIAIWHLWAP